MAEIPIRRRPTKTERLDMLTYKPFGWYEKQPIGWEVIDDRGKRVDILWRYTADRKLAAEICEDEADYDAVIEQYRRAWGR